jgi:hypothetical protein
MLMRVLPAAAIATLAAACGYDPGAPLIPVPDRGRVEVDPASVPATTADGFPNVLADTVTFREDTRTSAEIAATEDALAARGSAVGADAAGATAEASEAELLRRRAATHAAEAEAQIEASGRINRP